MKTPSENTRFKKTWSSPTLEVLAHDNYVNGGAKATLREGAPVGGGMYKLNTPGGVFLNTVPKALWDGYHS